MSSNRLLVVTADDFGIGPETSRGVLDLAATGAVTSTVLLVTSPHAADAVRQWEATGRRLEVGWHPCLTLDRPVLPPERVPSLVAPSGEFRPLGAFLLRLLRGRVDAGEVRAELAAQLGRFRELTGHLPANVNAHHHVHVFPAVRAALADVLADAAPRPFVRRVREPLRTLTRVPGARAKRLLLSGFGRRGIGDFPGADALAGVTDPPFVRDPDFFARWLRETPGRVVELACHPGHWDDTLLGRDGTETDGAVHRRPREWSLLASPGFADAVREAGFRLVPASAACSGVRRGGAIRAA